MAEGRTASIALTEAQTALRRERLEREAAEERVREEVRISRELVQAHADA